MQIPQLAIAIILDKTGPIPVIRVADVTNYVGIAPGITGFVSIKQPDQTTVTGNINSPDIYYAGSALVNAQKELRLASDGKFQKGIYVISYTARCVGYDDTTISQSFDLDFEKPKGVISPSIDVFTPSLKVNDVTNYVLTDFGLQSLVRSWSSQSTPGDTVGGDTAQFDLNIAGTYYDSVYTVLLKSIVTYVLFSASNVSLIDSFDVATEVTTVVPVPLNTLFGLINTFKLNMNKGCKCKDDFNDNKINFSYAMSLYQDFLYRGTCGDRSTLVAIYNELRAVINNGVSPVYVQTDDAIPTYNFGNFCGIGSAAVPLFITQQPISLTVNTGLNAAFSVAASGLGPLSYQWRKNSVPIGGATSSSLNLSNVQNADQASYDCNVTDAIGNSVLSNSATLTVTAAQVTFQAKWGWFDTDPYTALQTADALTYQGGGTFNSGQPVVADFRPAPNLKFLVMREPVAQPAKTVYYNSPLINGNLPSDPAIRDPFVANGFRYYITRELATFDPGNTTTFS